MTLNMICMDLDLGVLYQWGHSVRLGGDAGYLFHAASRKIFGELGPQPFLIQSEHGRVLGYTAASEEQLRNCINLYSALDSPVLLQALRLPPACCKSMPERWISGQQYRYSVFCRPTARNDKIEGDVWLLETHRRYLDAVNDQSFSGTLQEYRQQHNNLREPIYRAWFQRQFDGNEKEGIPQAAQLETISIDGCQCNMLTARGGKEHSGAPTKGKKRNMPEISLSGVLRVADSQAFARLVKRGIGRHRAFGYGMLLLKPGA